MVRHEVSQSFSTFPILNAAHARPARKPRTGKDLKSAK
jgi:hypothetical protein